jgi:hypothetical protein
MLLRNRLAEVIRRGTGQSSGCNWLEVRHLEHRRTKRYVVRGNEVAGVTVRTRHAQPNVPAANRQYWRTAVFTITSDICNDSAGLIRTKPRR